MIGDFSQTRNEDNRTWDFGNVANDLNFNNLFGGGNNFNLGAGSSSFLMDSTTTDLSSILENTKTDASGMKGATQDIAASFGFGFGGGTGSGGPVEKQTNTSDSTQLTANRSSGLNKWVLIGGGGFLGVLMLILILKKRKK